MEGTARIWFTPQQRAELWERWKNGQCVADIARALERRNKSGVYRILALNGGRLRYAPESCGSAEACARRSRGVLPSVGRCGGSAQDLRRSPSTVSQSGDQGGGQGGIVEPLAVRIRSSTEWLGNSMNGLARLGLRNLSRTRFNASVTSTD
jgi:hypothetical protein